VPSRRWVPRKRGYHSRLRRRGREVRQGPAKPRTAVRFRSAPLSLRLAPLSTLQLAARVSNTVPPAYGRSAPRQETEREGAAQHGLGTYRFPDRRRAPAGPREREFISRDRSCFCGSAGSLAPLSTLQPAARVSNTVPRPTGAQRRVRKPGGRGRLGTGLAPLASLTGVAPVRVTRGPSPRRATQPDFATDCC
jgi:hypothetical protein